MLTRIYKSAGHQQKLQFSCQKKKKMFIRDNNLNHIFLNAFVKKRKLTENKKTKETSSQIKFHLSSLKMHENAFF